MTQPRSAVLSADGNRATSGYRLVLLGPSSTALLKSVVVRFSDDTSSWFDLYARHEPGGHVVLLKSFQVSAGRFQDWTTWLVLDSLDELVADVGGVTVTWWLSGSILAGTLDSTPVPVVTGVLPAPPVGSGGG